MSKAKSGDKVKVHYTGKLADGKVFDTSREGDPLEFTLGANQVIPGFEEAIEGLEKGEKTEITLKPDDAYGERRDDLILEVPPTAFKEQKPEIGQIYEMTFQDSQPTPVLVTDVKEETVTLDANHPLAGKSLIFDIELVEIG